MTSLLAGYLTESLRGMLLLLTRLALLPVFWYLWVFIFLGEIAEELTWRLRNRLDRMTLRSIRRFDELQTKSLYDRLDQVG